MTNRLTLPTPLVSTDWLAQHLDDQDLRVLDATAHLAGPESGNTGWSLRPGRDTYLAAHIPGAAFVTVLDGGFRKWTAEGRHRELREIFASVLSRPGRNGGTS